MPFVRKVYLGGSGTGRVVDTHDREVPLEIQPCRTRQRTSAGP